MKKILSCLTIIAFFIPELTSAQMFSVGDTEERTDTRLGLYSTLGVSWEIGEFEYKDDDLPPAQRADFQDSIIRLRFENPGLYISAGFGGSFTGMDDRSYLNVNAMLYNDIALVRSQRFILGLPIQITTDLKSVALQQQGDGFQQSSLVFGTGASMRYRVSQRVEMSLRATPNYGFSFSQGAFFGGSLFTTKGVARLFFDRVIGSNTLAIGYDFDFKDYNIDEGRNNYQYLSHSFTVGIAF